MWSDLRDRFNGSRHCLCGDEQPGAGTLCPCAVGRTKCPTVKVGLRATVVVLLGSAASALGVRLSSETIENAGSPIDHAISTQTRSMISRPQTVTIVLHSTPKVGDALQVRELGGFPLEDAGAVELLR